MHDHASIFSVTAMPAERHLAKSDCSVGLKLILLIFKLVFAGLQHGWLQASPLEKKKSNILKKACYLGLRAAVRRC